MSDHIYPFTSLHSPVFLINSCPFLFAATPKYKIYWYPFSRSYRVNLPSSFNILNLPPQNLLPIHMCLFQYGICIHIVSNKCIFPDYLIFLIIYILLDNFINSNNILYPQTPSYFIFIINTQRPYNLINLTHLLETQDFR